MNILLFFENIIPESNAVSVRSNYLIKELIKHDGVDKLTILTATENVNQFDCAEVVTLGNNLSIRKNNFLSRIFREFKLAFFGIKEFIKLFKAVDVFYISTPPFITCMFLVLACKVLGKKYILEIRDIYPEVYLYSGIIKEGLLYNFFLLISKHMYIGAKLNVCATDSLKETILQKAPNINVVTGLNGFPSQLMKISDCKKYEKFTIVFHGILGQFQDIQALCDIAIKLGGNDEVDFIVIGDGSNSLKVKEVFSQFNNLHYYGKKSFFDTMNIVKRCHLGMSLRRNDPLSISSFPVKSWEYFGLGIPSVTTPIGSEADAFLKKLNCSVPIGSEKIEDIINAILYCQSNPSTLEALSYQAKVNRSDYTREKISSSLAKTIISTSI
jgi:hypothetical protein